MTFMLGISGRAGAGKDHLFKTLEKEWKKDIPLGPKPVRFSFADVMRMELATELGIDGTDHENILWQKPYSPDIRALLQWYGTWKRESDPDYWVRQAESIALGTVQNIGGIPVFTDVRFPNEAEMIRRNGGILVRVEASEAMREERLGALPPEHISETALDSPIYEFDNAIYSEPGPRYDLFVKMLWQEIRGLVDRSRE